MTNFEKIKAMSPDEMADFMHGAADRICFENCIRETGNEFSCKHGGEIPAGACVKCMKHWLESEAADDE